MKTRASTLALGAWALATGATLAVRLRQRRRHRDVTASRAHTARTVTIRREAGTLYELWKEPDTFARFFRGVDHVEVLDAGRERWTLSGRGANAIDVLLIDDAPGERIEWRAPRLGRRTTAQGAVTFAAGSRGTEVRLSLALDGPLARTAAMFARAFGVAPPQVALESLRAFKALAETGEIPKAVND